MTRSCVLQLTSSEIKPWLGPENEDKRRQVQERAQRAMRSQFRCEALPSFRESLTAMVDAAYPGWFVHSFYSLPLAAGDFYPCVLSAEACKPMTWYSIASWLYFQ